MANTGMILAAGRGERMRPLTDVTPKPLLAAGGQRLIEYQIQRLVAVGCQRIVVNQGWLGEQLPEVLGSGERYGTDIVYSSEMQFPGALETAGGICHALDWLGDEFYVVNGDVYCDADLSRLHLGATDLACLQLVANPAHNPEGDFSLNNGRIVAKSQPAFTFSGEGLYRRDLFVNLPAERQALKPVLDAAIQREQVAAVLHDGNWFDIGTPERLQQLDVFLRG